VESLEEGGEKGKRSEESMRDHPNEMIIETMIISSITLC
jgi:hypothetical protein